MDILLFRLAIACWLIAVIAPIDGTWFAGIGLFVVSVMGGVVMLTNLTLDDVSAVADVLGLFNLLMPWYNLIFLWGLFRFASPEPQPWSLRNLLLYACALHATSIVLVFVVPSGASLTVTATGIRQVLRSGQARYCCWHWPFWYVVIGCVGFCVKNK